MVDEIPALLEQYGDEVFEITEQGKIRCKLTSHEFPQQEFKKYVQSKKFTRAHEFHKFGNEYSEFFEDIGKNLLGCKLTLRTISKNPDSLLSHINGKKFKNALRKHQEKQLEEANQPPKEGDDTVKTEDSKQDTEMPSENEEEKEAEEEVKPKQLRGKRAKPSGTKRKAVKKARKN